MNNKKIINKIYSLNYTNNLYYHLNKKYDNKIKNLNDLFYYINISITALKKQYDNNYIINNYIKVLNNE